MPDRPQFRLCRIIAVATLLLCGCIIWAPFAAADMPRSVPAVPADYLLSGDLRWVVLASRQDGEAAIGIARRYAEVFASVQVVRAQNGRYAVIVGPERVKSPEQFKQTFATAHEVPKDFYLARGEHFVARAWRPTGRPLARAAVGGPSETATADGISASLRLESVAGPDERVVVMEGREGGKTVFTVRSDPVSFAQPVAAVNLVRLEGSAPQAAFGVFSEGAHCCTATQIATKDPSAGGWRVVAASSLDGDGYRYEDVDGDGLSELLSGDNRFLYTFDGYAGSVMPARIEKLINGRIVDVTRQPEYLRYHRQYLAALEDGIDENTWRSNGFLAGWVAQKILVREGTDAWTRMLQTYDRNSGWAQDVCTVPMPVEQCPADKKQELTFPAALRKFLDESGYR